jgi:hypothetical protein
VDYDGRDHTLIRDEDILLVYTGDEMKLGNIEPAWDRIIVKVASTTEATTSGIVVAPTSGGNAKASEGEVRRCLTSEWRHFCVNSFPRHEFSGDGCGERSRRCEW